MLIVETSEGLRELPLTSREMWRAMSVERLRCDSLSCAVIQFGSLPLLSCRLYLTHRGKSRMRIKKTAHFDCRIHHLGPQLFHLTVQPENVNSGQYRGK